MNNTIRSLVLLATLAVACPSLWSQNTNGQISPAYIILPSGLPSALPIGDELTIRNWIVSTNGSSYDTHVSQTHPFMDMLAYYDYSNQSHYIYNQYGGYGFESYDDYVQTMAKGAMSLLDDLIQSGDCPPENPVWYVPEVIYSYLNPPGDFVGINFWTNIGPLSLVTSNTFLNALPISSPAYGENIVMQVPGLSYFRVDVGTPTPCWYSWENGASTNSASWNTNQAAHSYEQTCSGYLVLSHWYSIGSYWVRITLTVNGQTAVYTQYGDMIAPPVVQLSRSKQLLVTAARGADITIWKSSDLLVWSIVSNFTSPITAQQSSIILNTSSPFNFYRASIK